MRRRLLTSSMSTARKKTICVIDLFCGAGGLTRGFIDAGLKVRLGLDVDEACRYPYEKNNAGVKFLACDISNLRAKVLNRNILLGELGKYYCQPLRLVRDLRGVHQDRLRGFPCLVRGARRLECSDKPRKDVETGLAAECCLREVHDLADRGIPCCPARPLCLSPGFRPGSRRARYRLLGYLSWRGWRGDGWCIGCFEGI